MNLKSAIESILFIQGEPMAVSKIMKAANASKKEVVDALAELAGEYRERGIVLIENQGEWQFATHPANKAIVEKFITSGLSEELTKAGLEVLAIIAYKGPISRASIEYVRGVNSSFTVRNLLIRGLIGREENPKDKRSFLYRISTDFLKHLGITNITELPQFTEFKASNINPPAEPPPDLPR